MLYLAALSAALATALVAYLLIEATPARAPRPMQDRMMELGLRQDDEVDRQTRRRERRRRFEQLILVVGERFKEMEVDYGATRERLIQAGYRNAAALGYFLGLRVVLTVGLGLIGVSLGACS
jgi:ribosomal protein L17